MQSMNAVPATRMRSKQTGIRGRTVLVCAVLLISVSIGCEFILPINRFIELPTGETILPVIAGARHSDQALRVPRLRRIQ